MTAGAQMTAEMAEQPRVLAALAARRDELTAHVREALPGHPAGIVLVARGSSDNAAVFGRYVLELATHRPVALAAPSLVTRYGVRDRLDGWLAVGVSQSGRTPEIVSVLESFGAAGATTVAITNDRDSALASAAHATIDTAAGAEKAVPATKTVTSQFAAFALLAEALAGDDGAAALGRRAWGALPDAVGEMLADDAPAAPRRRGRGRDAGPRRDRARPAARRRPGGRAEVEGDDRHPRRGRVGRRLPARPDRGRAARAAGPDAQRRRPRRRRRRRVRRRRTRARRPRPGDLPRPATSRSRPSIPDGLAGITAIVRAQQLAREVSLQRGIDPDAPSGSRRSPRRTERRLRGRGWPPAPPGHRRRHRGDRARAAASPRSPRWSSRSSGWPRRSSPASRGWSSTATSS